MDKTGYPQEVTVHRARFIDGRGPVFYASSACGLAAAATAKGCETASARDRHRLVSTLWDHLAAAKSPVWKRRQSSGSATFPIQVVHGVLGKPHFMLGGSEGPAISFSKSGGKIWAALCGDASDIGIDVAAPDEFRGAYPFHRVFQPQELHQASLLARDDVTMASALLWSAKEAIVKALGCAFHLVDPRQITVSPSAEGGGVGDGWHAFTAVLSGKALERFPRAAGEGLWVRSLLRKTTCLSIALCDW